MMTETFTAMSWNVQGEIGIGDGRLQRQLDFLDDHTAGVDLFLFQAVHYDTEPKDSSRGQLGALLDYFSDREYHLAHTGDWARELAETTVQPHADIKGAHNRCNVIASRWPLERRSLTLRNHGNRKPRQLNYYYSQFPEKILIVEIDVSNDTAITADTIEIWNVGVVNGANWGEEKLNMLETVYGRIYLQTTKTDTPVLLGGDFNAPKRETPGGEIIPHGDNAGQYMNYPYYGDPHYFRDTTDDIHELTFNQRWQLAEARLFDYGRGQVGDARRVLGC